VVSRASACGSLVVNLDDVKGGVVYGMAVLPQQTVQLEEEGRGWRLTFLKVPSAQLTSPAFLTLYFLLLLLNFTGRGPEHIVGCAYYSCFTLPVGQHRGVVTKSH
jgi:hypothetical protein